MVLHTDCKICGEKGCGPGSRWRGLGHVTVTYLKFWDPSISLERLKQQTLNLVPNWYIRCVMQKMQN